MPLHSFGWSRSSFASSSHTFFSLCVPLLHGLARFAWNSYSLQKTFSAFFLLASTIPVMIIVFSIQCIMCILVSVPMEQHLEFSVLTLPLTLNSTRPTAKQCNKIQKKNRSKKKFERLSVGFIQWHLTAQKYKIIATTNRSYDDALNSSARSRLNPAWFDSIRIGKIDV